VKVNVFLFNEFVQKKVTYIFFIIILLLKNSMDNIQDGMNLTFKDFGKT